MNKQQGSMQYGKDVSITIMTDVSDEGSIKESMAVCREHLKLLRRMLKRLG